MKIIKKTLLLLLVIGGVISCSDNDNDTGAIPQLIKQNVILTSGVDFDTAKVVALNPFTGKEIVPCSTTGNIFVSGSLSDTKQEQVQYSSKSDDKDGCSSIQTLIVDPDDALKSALKSAQSPPIQGTVRVNGKDKPARFIVSVTALYLGSHCATIYPAGQQLTNCVNKERYCAALAKYGKKC
jgi:hypothetical protein